MVNVHLDRHMKHLIMQTPQFEEWKRKINITPYVNGVGNIYGMTYN